jgi:hypothetical protein
MTTGHVRKRGNRWYFVHSIDDAATGRRRQKWQGGYPSRTEAERRLRESLSALDAGSWIEPTTLTYASYVVDVWLPQMRDQVEGSTLESYERNMRVHVLPRIGAVRLQKLGAGHLNELYRSLRAERIELPKNTNRRHAPESYARILALRLRGDTYRQIAEQIRDEFPTEHNITKDAVARIIARAREADNRPPQLLAVRTVRYIHTIISRSLKEAIRLGYLASNPASNASPPRSSKVRPERPVWTADETHRFLSWARDQQHRLWPAWVFVATSGDRRGANLGVRWADIDLGAARLE